MVKKVVALLFAAIFLNAGVFDFVTLKKAKEAYEKGEYKKAASLYEKIAEEGSVEAKFNAADALYKSGDYKSALKLFESVDSPALKFEKLHNIGNCYAKLGEIDKGIEAYEEALKIKSDKDTRFNLELLKKLKQKQKRKQQEKKSQNDQNKKQNREKNGKSRNSKSDSGKKSQNREQSGKDGEKKSEKKRDAGSSKSEQKKGGREMNKQKASKERQKSDKKAAQKGKESAKIGGAETKKEPISDMELRKWNKELNRRKIQTLMLPLETKPNGGEENEKSPW